MDWWISAVLHTNEVWQMTVSLRVWVIRTLLRGVNSIRGQNPLGLYLEVRPPRFYCLPDPPVLPTGSALRISTPLPEGSLISAPPVTTGRSGDYRLDCRVICADTRSPAICCVQVETRHMIAASSPSVSGFRRMSGVVPAPISAGRSCLDCERCSGGISFLRSDCVIQILPLHNQPDGHSYDGVCW